MLCCGGGGGGGGSGVVVLAERFLLAFKLASLLQFIHGGNL